MMNCAMTFSLGNPAFPAEDVDFDMAQKGPITYSSFALSILLHILHLHEHASFCVYDQPIPYV